MTNTETAMTFTRLARALLLFVLAALAAQAAVATPLDEAEQLMLAGNFTEAARVAEAEGSPAGLALAAKALSYQARCTLGDDETAQRHLFERAFELSGRAVELDPQTAEGWLQHARSYARLLNYRKDSMSVNEALEVVDELDTMLNTANAAAGDRAEAPMARGRVEIGKLVESRQFTGGLISLFGDRELALSDACEAIRRADALPRGYERTLVFYTIADGLYSLDPDRYAGNALAYLRRALEPCDDAVCQCLQKDAEQMLAEVRAQLDDPRPLARRICGTR